MRMVMMLMSGGHAGHRPGHVFRHHHGGRCNVDARQALDRRPGTFFGIGTSLKNELPQKSQKNHGDDCERRQTGPSVRRGKEAGHDARIWRRHPLPVKRAEYVPTLYFCLFSADYRASVASVQGLLPSGEHISRRGGGNTQHAHPAHRGQGLMQEHKP